MRIGVRELRQHASRYLDAVKGGDTVEVTERGELVALLVPPHRGQSARERLVAAGRLVPAAAPSGRLRAASPTAARSGAPSTAEALDAERDDRT